MSGWWLAASASSATPLHERDRGREVGELAGRARSPRRPRAPTRRDPSRPFAISASLSSGHCVEPTPIRRVQSQHAHREPRAARHRAAVRARPRRPTWSRSRTSATTRPRRSSCSASRATRCPRACRAGEIDAAVRERTLAGRGDLRARPRRARSARARADRHAGAVPGVRGLLRRGRRELARELPSCPRVIALDPQHVRRDARRRAHDRRGDRQARAGRRAGARAPRSAVDRVRLAVRGAGAPARGRARVARPRVRRGSLDAAADRARGRRGRARPARRAVGHGRRGTRSPPPRPRWSS